MLDLKTPIWWTKHQVFHETLKSELERDNSHAKFALKLKTTLKCQKNMYTKKLQVHQFSLKSTT